MRFLSVIYGIRRLRESKGRYCEGRNWSSMFNREEDWGNFLLRIEITIPPKLALHYSPNGCRDQERLKRKINLL